MESVFEYLRSILLFADDVAICSYKNCIDLKELSDKSGSPFQCLHVKIIKENASAEPKKVLEKQSCLALLDMYPMEDEVKSQVRSHLSVNSASGIAGLKLDSRTYIFRSSVNSVSPLPWVHVYKNIKTVCGLG